MNKAVWIGVAILLVIGLAWWIRPGVAPRGGGTNAPRTSEPGGANSAATILPAPAVRPSRYTNTTPDAQYVGLQKCAGCHASQFESYQRTDHSRALAEISLDAEPADANYVHGKSGREYRVFREGEELRQLETLRNPDGTSLVSAEHPITYVIGSGHHSRSYLVEREGFLVESPMTWYAAKQDWAMSPGYDRPYHDGFERLVDVGCIYCHAGRVETVEHNRFRLALHEQTIGCESCHGPGSVHVAAREADPTRRTGEDLTIVTPSRLDRNLAEAVCGQCHLRGAASVVVRGKQLTDYRPGLHLSDFRVDYLPDHPTSTMKVVGHFEQMRQSGCYQGNATFTCTTCHDPHAKPSSADRVEYYRAKCNTCHQEQCGLERNTRLARDPLDNCVACHMPQSPTDIPHFAFTHHRVGIHEGTDELVSTEPIATLLPTDDVSHLPPADQERNLGLAYVEAVERETLPGTRLAYRKRAEAALTKALSAGARDADTCSALARLAWEDGNLAQAIAYGTQSLACPPTSTGAHGNARLVLADAYLQQGDMRSAELMLDRLVVDRRHSQDYFLLAQCRWRQGNRTGALEAVRTALDINPFHANLHDLLAQLLRETGDVEGAQRHAEIAKLLQRPPPTPETEPQINANER